MSAERASIQCWPEGHDTKDAYRCEATIPDDSFETMERFGWGFGWAADPFSASGRGPFLMCPAHRGDCSEEQRALFAERYAKAAGTRS